MKPKTVLVPTSRGWKPVATRLLESVGIPVADESPANDENIRPQLDAEQTIRNGFRTAIIGVIDSKDPIPKKLRRIEQLLTEMERDTKAVFGKATKATTKTTEAVVTKLIGRRVFNQRQLLESKGGAR